MKNKIQNKEAFIKALLPLLNQMAKSDAVKFIAEKKQDITFADLMQLTDAELEALQKMVNSAKAGKESQQKAKIYDTTFVRDDNLESNTEKKYKIVCDNQNSIINK
jgi:hypothetical protein